MPAEQTLSGLIAKFQDSIEATSNALPTSADIAPPENGISLLDTKADLFLSYLQNLAFLILVKLRRHRQKIHDAHSNGATTEDAANGSPSDDDKDLDAAAVKKLVELRIYLEKGVRPLEGRLKYQIDKVLRAADTATRSTSKPSRSKHTVNGDDSADPDDESNDESEEDIDELAYRPNAAALARNTAANSRPIGKPERNTEDGIYRPPKITPTAMPTTDIDARAPKAARLMRSAAVDDYVSSELASAPTAEPSIGSGISAGGRTTTSARDRAKADERRAYEEANFIRLPKESKKEREKQRARVAARGGGAGEFDLSGLSAMGDRVAQATAKKGGKRGRDAADGQRGEGYSAGFKEKKRRKY